MTLKLTCPPRELGPNGRLHHMKRAKLVKAHRHQINIEARAAPRGGAKPRWKTARVQVAIFHSRKNYLLDPDNALAWMKTVFDGLTDAGIFSDDRELTHLPIVQEVDRDLAGTILVQIDPAFP